MDVEDEDEDESDQSDMHKGSGTIYLLVVEVCTLLLYVLLFTKIFLHQNLNVSAERILMSGRKM